MLAYSVSLSRIFYYLISTRENVMRHEKKKRKKFMVYIVGGFSEWRENATLLKLTVGGINE